MGTSCLNSTFYSGPLTNLNILDQVGGAVGHLLGCLHKVPLGHWVAGLAGGHLAGVAEDTGVLGNDSGCS